MSRPGFGEPHPQLVALLEGLRPLAIRHTAWADGAVPLAIAAHAGSADLPDELVTSVRCIVRVGAELLLSENEAEVHPWPGGRRESGESYAETALREVHEETGWRLEPASLRQLGWLHLHHLGPRHANPAYPYPDFLQLVFTGTAKQRDVDPGAPWKDTDGQEHAATLVSGEEALARIASDPVAAAFLRMLLGSTVPQR